MTKKKITGSNKSLDAAEVHAAGDLGVVEPVVEPRKIEIKDERAEDLEEVFEKGLETSSTEELLEDAGFKKEEDELDEIGELEGLGENAELARETASEVGDLELKKVNETGTLLDEDEEKEAREQSRKKTRKKWSMKKKVILGIVLVILAGVVAVLVYILMIFGKTSEIFVGGPIEAIFGTELKKDSNGRSNFLVFGTAEDDAGHGGALLADSILVVSLDQESGDAKMFSVPRDLWVGYGLACSVGYQGKINATYMCGLEANDNNTKAAGVIFANKVGEVFGMEIPYFLGVDFTVVKEVTDALGGIDVDVYSDDPRGLYDVNMKINFDPGVNHLDGEMALGLARARNSDGGYGLSRSNFDREINQQRIIQAMVNKAGNIGFLTNVGAVMGVLDSLGNNVKTNISMGEIRVIVEKLAGGKGIASLDSSGLFKTGSIGGASVVIPKEATTDNPFIYTGLRAWAKEQFEQKRQD